MMRQLGGVSHRMLTLTLRSLERDGPVSRTAYATIPPKGNMPSRTRGAR
ncbi:winged helix-turn-helix transcriptional regulator [Sinorhizobium meliloti]|nr:winged helix-turn-helix transcriptional regulator [Sinorhizobium meliloti]